MNIPEFVKEYISKCLSSRGTLLTKKLNFYSTPELKEWISQYPNYKWIHIFHLIKLELDDIPLCPVCGSKVFNFYKGKRFCSKKCSTNSPEVKEKNKKTCLKKYGVENPKQSKDISNKIKKTCLEKYGVENPWKNSSIRDKIKSTNLERYGVENPTKSNIIKDKIKKTNIERYGVEYQAKRKEVLEKIKQTNLKIYGAEYPTQSKDIQDKIKQTNLERYGTENVWSSDIIKKRIKNALIKKYGVENILQSKEYIEKIKKTQKEKYYDIFINNLYKINLQLLDTKEEFINNTEHKFKCLKCNTEFLSGFTNIQVVHCINCFKRSLSNKEKELYDFIVSIYQNKVIKNTRKIISPLELDIYIPDKNLAIEFNGDYWHSSERKDKNYHLNKTLECKSKGIQLIHIFEHEWASKRHIVESIIRNKLGLIENKIYARKTIVKEISQREYSNFLELNHIQGSIVSKYRYGLFYNSELVSVIGFGVSRFKKNEFELHRFCSKLNYSIIGGFSKLIKHFMNQNICSEFITYVDRSKFDGDGYFKIGFKILSESSPSYFYTKNSEILSRYQCQKHKLSSILENYGPSLSESDNMILNGYLKVYDCGTLKLIYKKNS